MQYTRIIPQAKEAAAPKRDQRIRAVLTANQLLDSAERLELIQEIQDVSASSSIIYQTYYQPLINNFAEFVQQLESFEHPMVTWLDHQLRLAKTTLKMREQFLLVGESLRPVVTDNEALWHYVTFSSALLRRIGLIFTHYQVSLCSEQGTHLKDWQPFEGSMNEQGNYYKLREITDKGIPPLPSINQLLARQLMPAEGFAWIAKNPEAFKAWLGVVEGESSGGVSHTFVALSEKILYELAQQEELLENLYRAESLQDLLRLTKLSEQELLRLLPPLHGEKDLGNPLALEFFEWFDEQKHQEGALLLINEQQYLLTPLGLTYMLAEAPPRFKNWFNFYKNGLMLGLTVLSPSDKALQSYLSKSNAMRATTAVAPVATPKSEVFHKTLHENAKPTAAPVDHSPEAIQHQQNVEHTVHALNNQGLMVGALFGSAHYHAYSARNVMTSQKQQTKYNSMQVNEQHDLKDKTDFEFFVKQRQQLLRDKVKIQYPLGPTAKETPTYKSSFTYTNKR
ncbi:MAG: TraI domain-containing protein [Gammaproteobacteria bacterium]|jgi:hypothetical protein